MTTTYDPTVLATSPKDEARFLINDIGPTTWVYTDEQVLGVIGMTGNACRAAVMLARSRAMTLIGSGASTSESIGDLSVTENDSVTFWENAAKGIEDWCRARRSMSILSIGPGGVDYGYLPHLFRIGQHDAPGTAGSWAPRPGEPYETLDEHWGP